MANPLFSTYIQGENRVTSTLMAVFEHVNNRLAEDILEALVDESDLSLVSFENQVSGSESVPDAAIRSSIALWFETKTETDAVRESQLRSHLKELEAGDAGLQRLVVLTPDLEEPSEVDSIDDDRLVWGNFDALVDSIEAVLGRDVGSTDDSLAVPTEREAFLLQELVRFLYDEELVSGKEDRVLVVAARKAWPEYQDYGLYFCQPNRSFKPVSHMAFYTDGEIKTEIPRVTTYIDSIPLSEEGVRGSEEFHEKLDDEQRSKLVEAVKSLESKGSDRFAELQKVMFLEREVELGDSVQNDKTASGSDRNVAFVQGHRYVSLNELESGPEYTSELE